MSIGSISNTALYALVNAAQNSQNGQGAFQTIQNEFQQLGQDLQTGNLTQAQQDYATLSQNIPNAQAQNAQTQTAQTQNNTNPIAQAFNALAQDLQTGNLSAALQNFATIQQDVQQQAQQQQQGSGQVHHHHHHGGGGGGEGGGQSQEDSQILQAFNSLSQALQSGNLSGAQSAFATLDQELQQLTANGNPALTNGANTNATQANGNALNVTA
ncbi:MAG: hypothetical protein WB780_12870 [Candidatus Acidiferrales bacterium]